MFLRDVKLRAVILQKMQVFSLVLTYSTLRHVLLGFERELC
jgi:hypothetical protein